MRCKINKKGQGLTDAVFVIFFIVILGFMGLIISKIVYQQNENIQENARGLNSEQLSTIDGLSKTIPRTFDAGVVIALMVAFLVVIITSLLMEMNVLFFLFGLLYYVASLILIPIAANIYIKAHNLAALSDVADLLPMTNIIMGNYVLICVVMSSVVLSVLYMRSRG